MLDNNWKSTSHQLPTECGAFAKFVYAYPGDEDSSYGEFRERGSFNQVFQGDHLPSQRLPLSGDFISETATRMPEEDD